MPRTDAQIRASAQRKLAKELKAGTFKPSAIGTKAREAATKLKTEKDRLIARIKAYKDAHYTHKTNLRVGKVLFNQRRSDKSIEISPITGKRRTIEELRTIADIINQAEQGEIELDWLGYIFDDDDHQSAFYYH